MPKQVDHQARRQRIADAVCRLVAHGGFDGATLRQVAAEAGVSLGQVQHYFSTKDEMLLFAFHTLSGRMEQRLSAIGALDHQPPPARAVLRALLVAMVPHDADSRFEAPLWAAFLARAVTHPVLAEPLNEGTNAIIEFAAGLLRQAGDAGEISAAVQPEHEATALFALADGLMFRALIDPARAPDATAVLDHHLDRLFGPE